EGGLFAQEDGERLVEAYACLGRVENRLQMVDERQTQALPPPGPEQERLAHSLDFGDSAALEAELHRHRSYVAQAFRVLLGQEAKGERPVEPALVIALDEVLDDTAPTGAR